MLYSILSYLMYPFLFFSMYFQFFLLLSFFENRKKITQEEKQSVNEFPSATIAIPCWNEERTLGATIDSLLNLNYPKDKLHIAIVDNNSTDNTLAVANTYAARYPEVISVLSEKKQGKHHAVNLALSHAKTDLFGCLDADSFVEPQTLSVIVGYFNSNKEIMAVTPCIHIKSPKTLVQRMQALEYLMGVFLRKAYGELDAIQVTPGPFSIFRREVFEKIGNYKKAHNTEDFEITLRMHKHHMRIVNSHKALVYTVGPATAKGFFYQRLRWARGFLQNALDYKEMFFKKEYGNFGMFTLPIAFVFVFYGLYASLFSLYSIFNLFTSDIHRWITVGIHPQLPSFDLFYINTTVLTFIAMVLLTVFLFTLYIGNILSDDRQEFYKNFPIFFIIYPWFIPFFLSRAIFDTVMKRKNEWVLQDTKTQ